MSDPGPTVLDMLPHPWRRLRALGDEWRLRFGPLPDGDHGATNVLTKRIVLVPGLTQAERRSTLAHELEHAAGHTNERVCDRNAARYLLPDVRRMGEALAWAHDIEEAADELFVDLPTLLTRLDGLHPCERAYLRRRLADGPGVA